MKLGNHIYKIAILTTLFICTLPIISLSLIDLIFLRSPNAPKYEERTVKELCKLFEIPSDDTFCINSHVQVWYSLEAILERRYPARQAAYRDIMNNLEINETDLNQFSTGGKFAAATCPSSFVEQDIYTCYIVFQEDVRPISVVFERATDLIVKIGVGHTGT